VVVAAVTVAAQAAAVPVAAATAAALVVAVPVAAVAVVTAVAVAATKLIPTWPGSFLASKKRSFGAFFVVCHL
jgi:hypothetical protein